MFKLKLLLTTSCLSFLFFFGSFSQVQALQCGGSVTCCVAEKVTCPCGPLEVCDCTKECTSNPTRLCGNNNVDCDFTFPEPGQPGACLWEYPVTYTCYEVQECPTGYQFCGGCIGACRPNTKTCAQWLADPNECQEGPNPDPTTAPPGCTYDPASCSPACGQYDNCGNKCPTTGAANPASPPNFKPLKDSANNALVIDGAGAVSLPADNKIKLSWTQVTGGQNYELEIYDAQTKQVDVANNNNNVLSTNEVVSGFEPALAVDGNNDSFWKSRHQGVNVSGQDWMQVRFQNPGGRIIRRISYKPGPKPERIDKIKVEYRSFGGADTNWYSAGEIPLDTSGGRKQYYSVPNPPSSGKEVWRITAAGNPKPSNKWSIGELGMYEQADANFPIIDMYMGNPADPNADAGRNYLFDPTILPTTTGNYVARVRAINITCSYRSLYGYSGWQTLDFSVKSTIEGFLYDDSKGQTAGQATCSLPNPSPAVITGTPKIGAEGVVSAAGTFTGNKYSITVPFQKPANYKVILSDTGKDAEGNNNACSCPGPAGAFSPCTLNAISPASLPAINQNFYIRSSVAKVGGNFYMDTNETASVNLATNLCEKSGPLTSYTADGDDTVKGTWGATQANATITGSSYALKNLPWGTNPKVDLSLNSTSLGCTCPAGCSYSSVLSSTSNAHFFLTTASTAWWQSANGLLYGGNTSGYAVNSPITIKCTAPTCKPSISTRDAADTTSSSGFVITGGGDIDTTEDANTKYTNLSGDLRSTRVMDSKVAGPREDYQYFWSQFSMGTSPSPDFNGSIGSKPSLSPKNTRAYYSDAPTTVSGSWTGANSVKSTEKIVIFVNGDLRISTNITVDQGGFLIFIVNGHITFDKSLGQTVHTSVTPVVEGVYVANGQIIVESDAVNGDKKFVGAGSFVGWSGISLKRKYANILDHNKYPTELFIYRPDLILNVPTKMNASRVIWQETN